MPQFVWPKEPIAVVQAFERASVGRGEAGALIMWAAMAAEGVGYLDDLNESRCHEHLPEPRWNSAAVSAAHIRWATGSAITALDLCAAAMARAYCGWIAEREASLRDFTRGGDSRQHRRVDDRVNQLPTFLREWVGRVLADTCYHVVMEARHPLTHSRLLRAWRLSVPDPTYRIDVPGNLTHSLSAGELVQMARDLSLRHVVAFLDAIDELSRPTA